MISDVAARESLVRKEQNAYNLLLLEDLLDCQIALFDSACI